MFGLGNIISSAVGNAVNVGLPYPMMGEEGGLNHEAQHQASAATQSSGPAGLPLPPLPPHIAALAAPTGQNPPVEGQSSAVSTGSDGGGGVSARESLRDPIVRAIGQYMGVNGWDSLPLAEIIRGVGG